MQLTLWENGPPSGVLGCPLIRQKKCFLHTRKSQTDVKKKIKFPGKELDRVDSFEYLGT